MLGSLVAAFEGLPTCTGILTQQLWNILERSASYSFRKRLISRVGRLAKFHQRCLIWHGFWRKVGLNDAVSTVSASSEQFGIQEFTEYSSNTNERTKNFPYCYKCF